MELDRHFIERNDFSAARRGYDPDEVDRHLREIADAVTELKRAQRRSPSSLAASAAADVEDCFAPSGEKAGESGPVVPRPSTAQTRTPGAWRTAKRNAAS